MIIKYDKSLQDSDLRCGIINFCSWHRLKPYLEQASGISENEEIVGVIVSEAGLEIKIRYKKND